MAFRCRLREIVGEMIGRSPENVQLQKNAHGKPFLPGGPHFNLSHDGDSAVLAVCREAPVGVDMEPRARGAGIADCLETIAHPRELTELRELDPRELGPALIRLWVAKEAALKALGTGLSVEPSEFAIAWSGPGRAKVEWSGLSGPEADEIHVARVPPGDFSGMEVAVALLGACPVVIVEQETREVVVTV